MIRVAFFILLGVVAAFAVLSVKIIGEDELWLVGEGDQVRELQGGVNLVRPFAAIRRYDLRARYAMTGEAGLRIPLKKGESANLDCILEARLERDKIKALDREYEGRILERLLRPLLGREITAALRASPDPKEVSLDSTGAGVRARLNAATEPLGIEITSVDLKNLEVSSALPPGLTRTEGLKVFILGFDGYDWMLADLISETHSLPNIDRIRRQGSWGNLRSIEPLVSPLIWTTIATGVTPDIHGITDFLVKDERTGAEIPATSTMRRVPAIWDIASLLGLRSGFVGWLATYPAEEVEGFMVSDRVAYHMFDPGWHGGREETPAEGLTYPPELVREIRPLFVEPEDVAKELAIYINGPVGNLKKQFDPLDPVSNLRLIISGYATYEGIVKKLYPASRPDLAGVYFEFTDSACHLFMRYMAPPMLGVTREEAERYGDGIAATYLEADRILGEVIEMMDDKTVLIVLSDHGFKSGDMRPMSDSRIGIGQAISWHRLNGAIALYGPSIKRGYQIGDASVLDIAPTVLHIAGLPVDKKMPGRVLSDVLEDSWVKAHPVRFTAQYDSLITGEGGVSGGPSPADQALKDKLQSLGYVAGGNASLVNMANFYHKNGRFAEAIEIWKKLVEQDANDMGARTGLSNAYFEVGKVDSAIAGLHAVLHRDARNMEALRSLATVLVRQGKGQEALRLADDALKIDPGDGDSHFNRGLALELVGKREEAAEEYRQAVRFAPDLAEPYANLAQMYTDKGQAKDALAAAEKAVDLAPGKPEMHCVLGQAFELNGRPEEALNHYMTSLRLDAHFAPAYIGACGVLLAQAKTDSALALSDRALKTSSQYGQYLHNLKGMAHLARRETGKAAEEFEAALRADGTFLPARINLARVYIAQGKTAEAKRELQAVLAVQPANQEARAMLQGLR